MSLERHLLARRNAYLAVPTPIYPDTNDSPIDLRKKVAIRRQYGIDYDSDFSDDGEEDRNVRRSSPARRSSVPINEYWPKGVTNLDGRQHSVPATVPNSYLLSLRNLHPTVSEQYGIQYALFTSPEGTHVVPVPAYSSPVQAPPGSTLLSEQYNKRRQSFEDEQHEEYRNRKDRIDYNGSHHQHNHHPHHNHQNHHREDWWSKRPNGVLQERSSIDHRSPSTEALRNGFGRSSSSPPNDASNQSRIRYVSESRFPPSRSNSETSKDSEDDNHNNNNHVLRRLHSSPYLEQQLRGRNEKLRVRTRLRTRSKSCSDVKIKSLSPVSSKIRRKKYHIHIGYDSDSEVPFERGKALPFPKTPVDSRINRPKSNGHYVPKKRKALYNMENDDSTSDSDARNQKEDATLLYLLSGKPRSARTSDSEPNLKSRGTDVLLKQLRQSPVNHHASRRDGYPWSVYEYYNHLVERFRDHPFQKRYPGSPVSTSPLVTEEDNGNPHRKRPTRALTGKHVKHGTGASPSTLITLRQKIQERQRAKETNGQHEENKGPKTAACRKPKNGSIKRMKQGQNLTCTPAHVRS